MGKKTVSKKVSKKAAPVVAFSITLRLGDKEFTSSGQSVHDALKALETPVKIVSKGFLHIEGGGKKLDKMYMPVQMKRILMPIARPVQAKNLALLMR